MAVVVDVVVVVVIVVVMLVVMVLVAMILAVVVMVMVEMVEGAWRGKEICECEGFAGNRLYNKNGQKISYKGANLTRTQLIMPRKSPPSYKMRLTEKSRFNVCSAVSYI